jgi:hypothetical protein
VKTNTGGEVPAFGRDALIDDLWNLMTTQSFQLLGERRTGKTTVVKEMWRHPRPLFLTVWRSVEGLIEPKEFVERLVSDVIGHLHFKHKAQNWLESAWKGIGGAKIGDYFTIPPGQERDWKRFLERTFQALEENLPEGQSLVFFWDEMPMFLYNVAKRKEYGEQSAMEFLDTLRALRQRHNRIRMVYTGSIGLHHVLKSLYDAGYSNAPVNDMKPVLLPPLSEEKSVALATHLLSGAKCEYEADLPTHIAVQANRLPFYIQFLVVELVSLKREITDADVKNALDNLLNNDLDPLDLKHYEQRIKNYYGKRESIGFALLDALAVVKSPLTLPQLLNHARSQDPQTTESIVRETIDLLLRDHYLQRNGNTFGFQYDLIRRAWLQLRWLEEAK